MNHRFALMSVLLTALVSVTNASEAETNTQETQPNWPSGELLVPKSGFDWGTNIAVGTIASPQEICNVFTHPFFQRPLADYNQLDSMNSDFVWDGIEASSLWVNKKFEAAGVRLDRLTLEQETMQKADYNLSACLNYMKKEAPQLFTFVQDNLLHYLRDECVEQKFRIEKTVDDVGNIIEKKVPLRKTPCLDFNYNSGRYGDWNSTTFALMLVWKEAHPVLANVFKRGLDTLEVRVAERDKELEQERIAQAEAQAKREKQQQARNQKEQVWQQYLAREKTLMEQVYNFSTTGHPNGGSWKYWVQTAPCIVTDGSKTYDTRKINMTAFRMYPEYNEYSGDTEMVSSDGNFRLSTTATIPLDRLQNAWSMAFKECPGRTSTF
ncbi:hypothetical protein CS022_13420 [Veronia nyctiphanis]|uniref:Uncharacterized protein n=2 Tax=Veronia nyctiphanis TaxID=1278244 RepID=A0A4Q0YUL5_9GAMM|nr:hypothetical protein CS022_13420 [Veronia nyctiphanis]